MVRKPRFRQWTSVRRRKRRPKFQGGKLDQGFYMDAGERIHYVPSGGRARSITSGLDVEPWIGKFDEETLQQVDPSALVPFVRMGVAKQLRGLMHRPKSSMRTPLLSKPESQRRYRTAFELTRSAILLNANRRERAGKLPNLQLYDLMAAIAMNAQSEKLTEEARAMLSSVHPEKPMRNPPLSRNSGATTADVVRHSRHSKRKNKGSFWDRREKRLLNFRLQRLGSALALQGQLESARLPFVSPKGTWNAAIASNPDAANSIHVVERVRVVGHRAPRRRRWRIHKDRQV